MDLNDRNSTTVQFGWGYSVNLFLKALSGILKKLLNIPNNTCTSNIEYITKKPLSIAFFTQHPS